MKKPSELLKNMRRRAEKDPEISCQNCSYKVCQHQYKLFKYQFLTYHQIKQSKFQIKFQKLDPPPSSSLIEIHAVNKSNLNSLADKLLQEIEKLNAWIDKMEFSPRRSPFRRNRSNHRSKASKRNRNLFAGIIVVSLKTVNLKMRCTLQFSAK